MKKVLTIIGIAVAAFFCIGYIVVQIGEAKLARQGFSAQERDMIRGIKTVQSYVNTAVGQESPKFISFTRAVEVLDDDGTLLGYSMDGRMEGATVDMRYFFLPGELVPLWWCNLFPHIDVEAEGRQHLREKKGL